MKPYPVVLPGDILVVEIPPMSSEDVNRFTTTLAKRTECYGVKVLVLSGAKVSGVIRPPQIIEVKK